MKIACSDVSALHAVAKPDDTATSNLGDDLDAFALKGNRVLGEGVALVASLRIGESRHLPTHLTDHARVWCYWTLAAGMLRIAVHLGESEFTLKLPTDAFRPDSVPAPVHPAPGRCPSACDDVEMFMIFVVVLPGLEKAVPHTHLLQGLPRSAFPLRGREALSRSERKDKVDAFVLQSRTASQALRSHHPCPLLG